MKKTSLKLAATVSSVASTIIGAMGEQRILAVCDIQVDPSYQRDSIPDHVKEMGNAWDWRKYTPVNVSRRPGGLFYAYDGGNRVVGARLAGLTHLPCYVVDCDDATEEATAFVGINEGRRRLKPIDKFKAMAAAGSAGQVFLQRVLADCGIEITSDPKCGPNKTTAIQAFMNRLTDKNMLAGMKDVADCIMVIDKAWHGQAKAFSGRAVEGMLRVLSRIDEDSRKTLFAEADKQLGRYPVEDLLLKAERLAAAKGCAICATLPEVFIDAFNYRRLKKRIV